jgi:hypothetical protein
LLTLIWIKLRMHMMRLFLQQRFFNYNDALQRLQNAIFKNLDLMEDESNLIIEKKEEEEKNGLYIRQQTAKKEEINQKR